MEPTGIFTFLFTDIESSTKLWEQYPDVMTVALQQHDAILRAAIKKNKGRVFKTVGDAFHAVFINPHEALQASFEAQRQLQATEFNFPSAEVKLQPKVRMALHTGAAEQRDDDYFGPALNRTARLLAAAHGGQILLSLTTREKLSDLPTGMSLQDLGERRLKDLVRPERLFQLIAPTLITEFPPLRSLEAFAHNLPIQLTSFVGREREVAEIKRLLIDSRLLTLTGVGGTGKTRLSLQVAADLVEHYADGVWLVEFASIADPSLVTQAMAGVFGVREEQGRTLQAALNDYLQAKHLLILFDNCEHLIESCAQLAETLLRACPKVQILASSREALGVAGEMSFRIPSLSIPDVRRLPPLESMVEFESVRLFVERTLSSSPSFKLTTENAPFVAQICQRLDGIPLAIELAAARMKSLAIDQIVARLDDRFRLLTGGSRTALPRQQTLQALIDWSYDLLSLKEQMLLRRLSVFVGGWTVEAAEAVCADDEKLPAADILDLLLHLVDKSLVVVDEQRGQTRYRYRKLETIRQYARTKLVEANEAVALRNTHLQYYLNFAEQQCPLLWRTGQKEALTRLEIEHDNLRVALDWSLGKPAEVPPEAALRLASALGLFWQIRGYWTEGREWLRQALEGNKGLHTVAYAEALFYAGFLALNQDTPIVAQPFFEESRTLASELKAREVFAWATLNFGITVNVIKGNALGRPYIDESLSLFEALGDQNGIGFALFWQGNMAGFIEADTLKAYEMYQRSMKVFQGVGNQLVAATVLRQLGFAQINRGNHTEAIGYLEEARTVFIEFESKADLAIVSAFLGLAALREGRYPASLAYYEQALALNKELGNRIGIVNTYGSIGWGTLSLGNYAEARKHFELQLQLSREINNLGSMVAAYNGLGDLARLQKDYVTAREVIEQQLSLARAQGFRAIIPIGLHNLGHVLVHLKEYTLAQAAFYEALEVAIKQDNKFLEGLCLVGLAGVQVYTGEAATAVSWLRLATDYFEKIGYHIEAADRPDYELYQAAARQVLGDEAYNTAWEAGSKLTFEQVVAEVLAGRAAAVT